MADPMPPDAGPVELSYVVHGMTEMCRAQHPRTGNEMPNTRIIHCGRERSHDGRHEEAETGVTWLNVAEKPLPRTWSMPEIPADVTRLSAVGGDLLIERVDGVWYCTSWQTGRVLDVLNTGQVLARYSPLTEVVSDGN